MINKSLVTFSREPGGKIKRLKFFVPIGNVYQSKAYLRTQQILYSTSSKAKRDYPGTPIASLYLPDRLRITLVEHPLSGRYIIGSMQYKNSGQATSAFAASLHEVIE